MLLLLLLLQQSSRLCFRIFFNLPEQQNTANTNVFGALEAQNHGIYAVFFLLRAKITVFAMFFGPDLGKTLAFTQFSACSKKTFSMPKAQKHCKLHYFYASTAPKKTQKINQKATQNRPKTDLQNASWNLTFVFPNPTCKPHQPERFCWRVGGRGAPPGS